MRIKKKDLKVNPSHKIPNNELNFVFFRASGPGGQNVNKVATAVQLRFDITHSPSLSDDIKHQLILLAGSKVTRNGILVINGKRFRSQELNRADVINRIQKLLTTSSFLRIKRLPTQRTLSSTNQRLSNKKHRARIKQLRQRNGNQVE